MWKPLSHWIQYNILLSFDFRHLLQVLQLEHCQLYANDRTYILWDMSIQEGCAVNKSRKNCKFHSNFILNGSLELNIHPRSLKFTFIFAGWTFDKLLWLIKTVRKRSLGAYFTQWIFIFIAWRFFGWVRILKIILNLATVYFLIIFYYYWWAASVAACVIALVIWAIAAVTWQFVWIWMGFEIFLELLKVNQDCVEWVATAKGDLF